MFDSHYDFTINEGYFDKVSDMTISRLNREHKHSDVESGLDDYTYNWECLDSSTERRRGSDKLYLVNDKYYIWCSRSGVENIGNAIKFSQECSEELRFTVWSTVFEKVLERKFGAIKDGICKESIIKTTNCLSPKTFVLAKKLSQKELDSYFDDMADLVIELIKKYHNVKSTKDIKNIVEWYKNQTELLYRNYLNFTPTILSQVLNNIDVRNGWTYSKGEVTDVKRFCVLINEKYSKMEDGVMYTIEINEGAQNEVNLVYEDDSSINILEERIYKTKNELRNTLEEWFEFKPNDYESL